MFAPFVRTDPGSLHPVIDLQALDREFASSEVLQQRDTRWVVSPADLFLLERLRRQFGMGSPARKTADVFVWAAGEPADRRLTKIGGCPYWPARKPWPKLEGKPATFLCQFNFRDSRELVPRIPGEILSVFVRDEDLFCEWVPERQFHVEWFDGDEDDLLDPRDVPTPAWTFFHGFGVRARTWDDSSEWKRAYALSGEHAMEALLRVPVCQATKIGGIAHDAQTIHVEEEVYRPGERLLCQLSSVQARSGVPWPWANRAQPFTPRSMGGPDSIYEPANDLMIGDVGSVAFLIDPRGNLRTPSSSS